MIKFVAVAAFAFSAVVSAFATIILVTVVIPEARDGSPWLFVLLYLVLLAATAALGLPAKRATAPLTPEKIFARLAKRQKRHLFARIRGEYLPRGLQTAAIRTTLDRGSIAVRKLGRGADHGFGALAAEAEAATARADPAAFLYWRDLGTIAAGLDDERSIAALRRANELSSMDFMTVFLLHNRFLESKKLDEARRAGEIGEALAKTDRERSLLILNVATASALSFDFRGAAIAAEKAAALARSSDPEVLDVVKRAAIGLGLQVVMLTDDADFATARWLTTAHIDLRRILAERLGTPDARKELAEALTRGGAYLVKRANTAEGRAMIAEGEKLGG